ncbi:gliding motility-associated protein GldE [Urechidicola vernalis]|uniref:Gliding motility-associated protein GldE n=1 Tax=Urechidicola vernalis TaxID=3075600 RepID=A0ABU2Y701_9FLAO|nr:gliding motility-associated protein GldE [Urechidicola sp. P050]MDT0553983.1 gliding motility-associated protein GldE [Urechidicola sp. P050]
MDPEPASLQLIPETIFTGIFILKLASILILLVCSAFISGAEVAFFSLSQTELEKAKESKSKRQKQVVTFLEKPKKLLATILVTNNFVNILIVLIFAYLSEDLFRNLNYSIDLYFFNLSVRFILEVVLITFLILLFGEVLPKVYANRNSLKFASFMVVPIKGLSVVFTPISLPLMKMTNLIERRLGQKNSKFSVETLSQALELTSDNATTEDEQKILEGIVSFGNTETIQIMKPRIDVFAISDTESFEKVVSEIVKHGFSRNPVYHESIDEIVGVLYAKDLLLHLDKKNFKWQSLLREVIFVPENKKLDDLLKEFQEKKIHLAVVVDEYGGTSGIVTLEDIIEEIVGDITDEFDDDDLSYSKLDANNYVFEGKTSIKDFSKVIGIEEELFEEEKGETETLAGFILEVSGKFPKVKEVIKFRQLSFKIEAMDKRRVKRIKVTINRKLDEN